MKLNYRLAEGRDGRLCAEIVQQWSEETPWLGAVESVVEWWTGCLHHVDTS